MKRRFVPPVAGGGAGAGAGGGAAGATPTMRRPFKMPALAKPAVAAAATEKPVPECSAEQQEGQAPLAAADKVSAAYGEVPASAPPMPRARLPGLRAKKRPAAAGTPTVTQFEVSVAAAEEVVAPTTAAAGQQSKAHRAAPTDDREPAALELLAALAPAVAAAAAEDRGHAMAEPAVPAVTLPAVAAGGVSAAALAAATLPAEAAPSLAATPAAATRPAAAVGPPAAAATVVEQRVLRLPAVLPEDLPSPTHPPSLPPTDKLLSALPRLQVAADALCLLDHPSLGDLGAAARQLEAAAVPQVLPVPTGPGGRGGGCCGIAAMTNDQLLLGILHAHPLPPARSRPAGPRLQQLHICCTDGSNGGSAAQPPAHAAATAAVPAKQARQQGQGQLQDKAAVGTKRPAPEAAPAQHPAGDFPTACRLAASATEAASGAAAMAVQQPWHTVPPPLDEAELRRALCEDQRVPLSYLRRLVYA